MRQCPKCQVDFQVARKTFAEIDFCPQCEGVFLDPGEGVSMNGADSDGSFLVADGHAKLVGKSRFKCPSTGHATTTMDVYTMGSAEHAIEFEHCPECKGFFLDKGEGPALDALDAAEITGASGARFTAPPGADRQSQAVEQARSASSRSFFQDFVGDCLKFAAQGVAVVGTDIVDHRRRRRRGLFG